LLVCDEKVVSTEGIIEVILAFDAAKVVVIVADLLDEVDNNDNDDDACDDDCDDDDCDDDCDDDDCDDDCDDDDCDDDGNDDDCDDDGNDDGERGVVYLDMTLDESEGQTGTGANIGVHNIVILVSKVT
jgi:hypothetical protein